MSAREEFEKWVCEDLQHKKLDDIDESLFKIFEKGYQAGLEAAAKHVKENLNICSPDHPDIAITIEICADAIRKLKE